MSALGQVRNAIETLTREQDRAMLVLMGLLGSLALLCVETIWRNPRRRGLGRTADGGEIERFLGFIDLSRDRCPP